MCEYWAFLMACSHLAFTSSLFGNENTLTFSPFLKFSLRFGKQHINGIIAQFQVSIMGPYTLKFSIITAENWKEIERNPFTQRVK